MQRSTQYAEVAELADAPDSKSDAERRAGSTPAFGTTMKSTLLRFLPRERFLFWCNRGATGKISDFRKMAIIVKCIKADIFRVLVFSSGK